MALTTLRRNKWLEGTPSLSYSSIRVAKIVFFCPVVFFPQVTLELLLSRVYLSKFVTWPRTDLLRLCLHWPQCGLLLKHGWSTCFFFSSPESIRSISFWGPNWKNHIILELMGNMFFAIAINQIDERAAGQQGGCEGRGMERGIIRKAEGRRERGKRSLRTNSSRLVLSTWLQPCR